MLMKNNRNTRIVIEDSSLIMLAFSFFGAIFLGIFLKMMEPLQMIMHLPI